MAQGTTTWLSLASFEAKPKTSPLPSDSSAR